MKTSEFLELLSAHQDKALLFEYAPNMLVGANYHITEVKHVTIDSVDCGSGTDHWQETIVQLWESPSELGKTDYMTTYKALGILKKVGTMKPYTLDADIKIEYSNAQFHTAQLFVNDFEIRNNQLLIKLTVQKTDCKAKSECGITETIDKAAEKVQSCCEPSSGCC